MLKEELRSSYMELWGKTFQFFLRGETPLLLLKGFNVRFLFLLNRKLFLRIVVKLGDWKVTFGVYRYLVDFRVPFTIINGCRWDATGGSCHGRQ
jgi:hypothetical protein